jgi:hypothetical protein
MMAYDMMPVSATSLKLFMQCPALYKARYIDKSFTPKSNHYLERGLAVHKRMERALTGQEVDWTGEEYVQRVAAPIIEKIFALKDAGFTVLAEYEAATNGLGKQSGWWDKDTYIRAKIDCLIFDPEYQHCMVIDWKTGKTEPDEVQLSLNTLCLGPILNMYVDKKRTQHKEFNLFYYYLDKDTCKHYKMVCDVAAPKTLGSKDRLRSVHKKALQAIASLFTAHMDGSFPYLKGDGCRFCEWRGCETGSQS